LDVERAAVVEFTSEDEDYPVESAFVSEEARGWRAAAPGSQTIRLVFDQPQRLGCISLVFEENETVRTQEFVLRWSPDGGRSLKEIVRQRWNFSPPETIRELCLTVRTSQLNTIWRERGHRIWKRENPLAALTG
jgi:5,10-methenyltetrahydromethanopterin hydrogenase